MVNPKELEIELKKQSYESYLGSEVSESENGKYIRAIINETGETETEDFLKNLENSKTLCLPKRCIHGESEVIINGNDKIEGYLDIGGKGSIIPKCHLNQRPYHKGNVIGCTDDLEETKE
jgi:hypothetical protein